MLSTTELPADARQYCWHVRHSVHEIWSQNKRAPPLPWVSILVIILSAYSRFRPSEVADFKLSCTHSIPAGLSLWQSRRWTLHWQPWRWPVRLQGWEESCTSVLKEQFDRSGKLIIDCWISLASQKSSVSCICPTAVWWEVNVWSDLKLQQFKYKSTLLQNTKKTVSFSKDHYIHTRFNWTQSRIARVLINLKAHSKAQIFKNHMWNINLRETAVSICKIQ